MNGRIYDPLIGRMFSPDNYVQDETSTQSYNRYSYCANNPMRYTDPSGEIFGFDDVALGLIGGTVNLLSNLGSVKSVGDGFAFFGIGFVAGVASEYISPVVAMSLAGAANAALGGMIKDGTIDPVEVGKAELVSGISAGAGAIASKALSPLLSNVLPKIAVPALRSAVAGGVSGTVVGSITGGVAAAITGTDFWQGVGQGAAWGAGTGFFTGAYYGVKSARADGINPWTGKRIKQADLPALSPTQIRAIKTAADELDIVGSQIDVNTKIIKDYYDAMKSPDYKIEGTAGYKHDGKVIISDGHHRTTAGLLHYSETGNTYILNQQQVQGRFQNVNPSSYGIKPKP